MADALSTRSPAAYRIPFEMWLHVLRYYMAPFAGVHRLYRGLPNPIGVIRTFWPYISQVAIMYATVYDLTVLKELRSALDSGDCRRLLSLGIIFKTDRGYHAGYTEETPIIAFPVGALSLSSLRVQRIRVNWGVSSGFGNLRVVVMRDLGAIYEVKWDDFHALFSGALRLQKLAVRNVACAEVTGTGLKLPQLSSLRCLDICFGATTSLESVLVSLDVPMGISVHFHGACDADIVAFGRCVGLLQHIGSFIYTGSGDDADELQELFLEMPYLTHLTLLSAEAELLDAILLADAVLTGERMTPSNACPFLHFMAFHDLEPEAFCAYLGLRGAAADMVKTVGFGRSPEWDRNFELDTDFFYRKGIRVITGAEYKPPAWLDHD
ncbi:hypothetical protein C8J57DRAFT_1245640 [Mycena rebaudengoi]|nr:hypothetical protein C8J57DRAFT_1245640 [Mycena rebaudengoi]